MDIETTIDGERGPADRVEFGALRSGLVALALWVQGERRQYPGAALVVRRFYPDIHGLDLQTCKQAIEAYLSGKALPGDAELGNFHEADPMLAGIDEPVARGFYRLLVAIEHIPHGEVVLSPGDCRDISELAVMLTAGNLPDTPVVSALRILFNVADAVWQSEVGSESFARLAL